MKKKLMILILLFVCGCADHKKQQTEIDPKAFGYEASYNLVSNGFAYERNIVELEDGLIYLMNSEDMQNKSMIYINNNDYQIVNASVGSKCRFDNLESCTGTLKDYPNAEYFYYYMDKIYFLYNKADEENDVSYYYLGRCDVDGENQESLFKLNYKVRNNSEVTVTLTYHKGYLYYSFGDNVLREVNLKTMEDKVKVTLPETSKIMSTYFQDDFTYIVVDYYEYEENMITDALLKLNLKDDKLELFMKDKGIFLIDGDHIIYSDESKKTFLYDMKSKESKLLLDTLCIYKFSNQDYFVLDSSDNNLENAGIYLFDKKGNQLDHVPNSKFHFGYGIIDNKYYFSEDSQLKYYEIVDGKFKEPYTFVFE